MTTAQYFSAGLTNFASRLRAGEFSVADVTDACLDQMDRWNPRLDAFQYIAADAARQQAKAMDLLLQAGHDFGPLMGVPIGVKDIIAVNNMPTTNGSKYNSGIPAAEGHLVSMLRARGCIFLGKTKTVEYALGATGINEARGTPVNPWDLDQPRLPGGSSSGSAVSVAAGMVAFALGSDTGGSVRIPACFNGLFGHKTTVGLWPTDGIFPLSPSLDSAGPLCRTAADALVIHDSLFCSASNAVSADLSGMRFGRPKELFFDELDSEVTEAYEVAQQCLQSAGAEIVDIELPEARERETLFPAIVPAELVHALTPDGFRQASKSMDSVTRSRGELGLSTLACDHLAAQQRRRELVQIGSEKMQGLTGWLSPTCPMLPMTVQSLQNPDDNARSLQASRNTQPGNLMGLCACSIPVQHLLPVEKPLPVGLQLMMPANSDREMLQVAMAIQELIGVAELPALNG